MKNENSKITRGILLITILIAAVLSSCNNEASVLKDQITPIQGKRGGSNIPVPPSYDSIRTELAALEGVPVFISVKQSNFGKSYLTSQGPGKEITVDQYKNTDAQKFYLKILPPTSGIPYLIYSYQSKLPISVGTYSNNPNKKVLYTRTDENGELFGASWDILKGTNGQSFVIESKDYTGNENGQGLYDQTLGVLNDAIFFGEQENLPNQEFSISPAEEFKIIDIRYLDSTAVVHNNFNPEIIQKTYENTGSITKTYPFSFNRNRTFSYRFSENSSTTINIPAGNVVKMPSFGSIGTDVLSLSPGKYSRDQTQSETTTVLQYDYPVDVPPGCTGKLSISLSGYSGSIDYIATCEGLTSHTQIKIYGTWSGACYPMTTSADVNIYPTGGSPSQGKKLTIRPTVQLITNK